VRNTALARRISAHPLNAFVIGLWMGRGWVADGSWTDCEWVING